MCVSVSVHVGKCVCMCMCMCMCVGESVCISARSECVSVCTRVCMCVSLCGHPQTVYSPPHLEPGVPRINTR